MNSVALDTNCIVALALAHHSQRTETLAALDRLEADGAQIVMLGHAIVEAYAVLTRLPGADRVSPALAKQVLAESWSDCPLLTLPAEGVWTFLDGAARAEMSGGRVYDVLLAEAARFAGVDVLLTWNARHFARWSLGRTRVLSPAEVLAAP